MSRFAHLGWPQGSALIGGGNVTSGGSAHTEGAWLEVIASSTETVGLLLSGQATVATTNTDTSMLLTIGTGGLGSEVAKINNIALGGYSPAEQLWLPLYIPAGSRVVAKLRAEIASDVFAIRLCPLYGSAIPGWNGYASCDTYGADTANSRGTVISNTAGTWTEITASTSDPLRALNISAGLVDNSATAAVHIVDLGVGGAGSEVILGSWIFDTSTAEECFLRMGPPFIEYPIPAGTRIAVKKNTTADLSVCVHGWR